MATHQEKDDVIKELRAKIKELEQVEKQVEAVAAELAFQSVGVRKDANEKYELVIVGYDAEKNLAAISEIIPLDSKDFAVASYKAKEYLVMKIMQKAKGGRYV